MVEQGIIAIATVGHDNGMRRNPDVECRLVVGSFSVGDIDELRQQTVIIQQSVLLYRSFLGRVVSPLIDRHGECDQRGVEQLDRHLETEFTALPLPLPSKMRIQGIIDIAEHAAVTVGVLISHSGLARCTTDAKVVQVACRRPQSIGDVTHRVALRKLTEHHAHELAPSVITLAVLVCACCPDYFSDNFFRQFAYYLRK